MVFSVDASHFKHSIVYTVQLQLIIHDSKLKNELDSSTNPIRAILNVLRLLRIRFILELDLMLPIPECFAKNVNRVAEHLHSIVTWFAYSEIIKRHLTSLHIDGKSFSLHTLDE